MKVKLADIKNTEPQREHGSLEGLKQSISEVGLINPLTIDDDGNLLAGRRRYCALCELGYTELDGSQVRVLPINGDKLKAFRIAIDENLKRKPLSNPEIATAIKEYDELKRKIEGSQPRGNPNLLHCNKLARGWTQKQTANELGISQPAVVKAIKIATMIEEHPELVKEKGVRILHKWGEQRGQFKLQDMETSPEALALPPGIFSVIYADPPWRYDFDVDSRATEKHYPTLTESQISNYVDLSGIKIQSKFADDAILYLWATAPKLDIAMNVIERWGFTYKTNMVWVKDKIGLGWYCRNQHELLLIAERGNMPLPAPAIRPPSTFSYPRSNHSRKPIEIYDIIEKCYPSDKYLELFGLKTDKPRPKWVIFGNEIYK